jgi:hypothetical protein
VNRLHELLKKHMTGEWKLVCITDDNRGLTCDSFPLWPVPNCKPLGHKGPVVPNCFVRLRIFDPEVGKWFGNLILSIDLDVVINGDLRPLLTKDGFVGTPGRHSPICGGMFQLRPGAEAQVWADFDPVKTPQTIANSTQPNGRPYSGSDQAWMSLKIKNPPTWSTRDGVYDHVHVGPRPLPQNARVVQTWGAIKPWVAETKTKYPAIYTPVEPTRRRKKNDPVTVVCWLWNDSDVPAVTNEPAAPAPVARNWRDRAAARRARTDRGPQQAPKAGRVYSPEHVNALRRQFTRHLDEPHRFVCIADDPTGLAPDVEFFRTPESAKRLANLHSPEGARFPSCYRRLWTWSDEAEVLGHRLLVLDIDTVLTNDVSPLLDYDEPFIGWRPTMAWGNKPRYAGGMYLLTAGAYKHVWANFSGHSSATLAKARGYRGSDQAWISYCLGPNAPVWPEKSGIYSVRDIERTMELPADARIVHFNGPTKPWQVKTGWVPGYWHCQDDADSIAAQL